MAYRFAVFIVDLIMKLIARVTFLGLENIPGGPFIGVSNHLGRLDPLIPYYFLRRNDVSMMVAEKYRKVFFLRWFFNMLDGIWVDRFNADMGAMREALNRLKAGGVLVVAPEGTRSKTEALLEGRAGSSYLAARTGIPILPVGVVGTEDRVVKAHLKRLRRVPITVNIGKPFTIPPLQKGEDKEAGLQQRTDEIMCHIAALLPESYRGYYAQHPRTIDLLAEQDRKSLSAGVHEQAGS